MMCEMFLLIDYVCVLMFEVIEFVVDGVVDSFVF